MPRFKHNAMELAFALADGKRLEISKKAMADCRDVSVVGCVTESTDVATSRGSLCISTEREMELEVKIRFKLGRGAHRAFMNGGRLIIKADGEK